MADLQKPGLPTIPPDYYLQYKPPGLMREIFDFILGQSPNPIPHVALAGSIALFAGIVGRQFNFSDDGLNQYMLLVAPTGMGKDAAKTGMSKILAHLSKKVPAALTTIGPADFASGPGLVKSIARRKYPCFVTVVGEVGFKLQQMANPKSGEHIRTLQKELLKLYSLSGEGRVLEGYEHSDERDSTKAVFSPALTILGEGTQTTVYEGLDERQVTNGLLSRFTIIEYDGECPPYNKGHAKARIADATIEALDELVSEVFRLAKEETVVTVGITDDADLLLSQIREYARQIINSKSGDVTNAIWTRVAQKIGRLAALLAVSHNWRMPVIDIDMIKWAASLILTDTKRLSTKFEMGEMGVVDEADNEKQLEDLRKMFRKFLQKPNEEIRDPKLRALHSIEMITYQHIHQSVAKLTSFRKDRRGATAAIKSAVLTLCEMGVLQERQLRTDAEDNHSGLTKNGRCFAIVNANWIHGIEEPQPSPHRFWN